MGPMPNAPALKRHLGLTTLTFYGVGVIVGAGIYVLIGKIAGIAGNAVWLVFVASAVVALPTGLSYAELASRYPKSAGEAVYADRAFGRGSVSFLVGFLILASGIASTAAVSHGFAYYLGEFVTLSRVGVITFFLLALTVLNYRGIQESTWVNIICTTVSVGALVVLVILGIPQWGGVDYLEIGLPGGTPTGSLTLVLSGAALAFFAYLGFEDICNVAEEVRQPKKTIPRAILLSVLITSLLYVGVGLTVVSAVPAADLAASDVPLALVAQKLLPALSTRWISFVALFAIFNTGLLNMIMASRILYGMGRAGWIPSYFGKVHPKRQTPVLGVIIAFLLAWVLAVTGFLKVLAEATNTIILSAFFFVNLSLLVVKLRKRPADDNTQDHFQVPLFVPILGIAITAYLVSQFSAGAYLRSLGLVAVGGLLYAVHSLKKQ